MKFYDQIESGLENPIVLQSNAVGAPGVTATMDIGGIKKGDTFTNIQELLSTLITPYKEPIWNQSLNPGKVEKGINNSITAKVTFTAQSNPVTDIVIDETNFPVTTDSGSKEKPITVEKNIATKTVSFSIKDNTGNVLTNSLSLTIEGKFKLIFSTKSSLTATEIHDMDNDSDCAVREFFTAKSHTVTNTITNAYTYFIVPSKYTINSIKDSMGTAVNYSQMNTLDVYQHDSSLKESYRIYRTAGTSSPGQIIYKINQ